MLRHICPAVFDRRRDFPSGSACGLTWPAERLALKSARWLAVVGLAVGLVLMTWTWLRAASMSADGAHYMELAERGWRLGASAGMDWYAGPGYPVAVAWMYGLVGNLDLAGRFVAFLFGLTTLGGVGILSYRMFGGAVAGLAISLLAVHTTFVRHSVMAETDTAYSCWLVWSILFTWELKDARSVGRRMLWASLAGVSLGLGYLTRPEAVPLAGLLGLWFALSKRQAVEGRGRPLTTSVHRMPWVAWTAAIILALASPYLLKLRADLGRWSLSGKERSIVLKFVPDKRNYREALELGVTGALLQRPASVLHWLPYHVHWGIPQFVKSLNPVVLPLALIGACVHRSVRRAPGAVGLLLWVSVPFILFFFLTFPGRRYFMQAMPPWTILAAVGTVELASLVAIARGHCLVGADEAARRIRSCRAFRISVAVPMLLLTASTVWGNRIPIESSRRTERVLGERILSIAGPGRRVLSFTVTAFHARAERVPLWGPMEGIVRCHGYGEPLSYEDLLAYCRRHRVEYLVLDHDLRADCPEFLDRVRPEDFTLVIDDIVDHHGPHLVYRYVGQSQRAMHAN